MIIQKVISEIDILIPNEISLIFNFHAVMLHNGGGHITDVLADNGLYVLRTKL